MNTKDKQSVVGTEPLVELLSILLHKVYGDVLPEGVNALLSELKTKNKKFVPPTLQEVEVEMVRIGVENAPYHAAKFWNFYDGKGWMVGKSKMKNWKSAIKTWDLPKVGPRKLVV